MITVQNLSFTYAAGKSPAVENISFAVGKGEIFGFLGPSGAGKSTTQKILTGLLKGYQGRILVMDKDLSAWGSNLYNHIGVSFELPNHYQKLTALENLQFFRSLYSGHTEDPVKLLDMVGLAEDAHRRVSQFSKGMQMRLTFARTLLNSPELIFLDEPTSGLDPGNARRLKEIVKDLKSEERTIFLTTHDMTVADALCDRVAFIVDGQIALIDSPQNLKIKNGHRQVRVTYCEDETTKLSKFALDTLGEDEAFLSLLRRKRLETIHSEEATLEDVFIQATGRRLV